MRLDHGQGWQDAQRIAGMIVFQMELKRRPLF
jgi:hypothetical protein